MALPMIALVWRIFYRTHYFPGWDLIGAAQGLYLIETEGLWNAIVKTFHATRHFQYWGSVSSIPYSLIPGVMTLLFPWEQWAHVLSFLTFLFSLGWIVHHMKLNSLQMGCFALALGCSSTLLSFSLAGMPTFSAVIPPLIALWMVESERARANWILSLCAGLIACELSFHVYPLGATFFIVLVMGVIFIRLVPWKTKLTWILISGLAWHIARTTGHARGRLAGSIFDTIASLLPLTWVLIKNCFIKWNLDLPILPILGFVSCFFIRKRKYFYLAILLTQWFLLLVLAHTGEDKLRPRRFLLVEWLNLYILGRLLIDRWEDLVRAKMPTRYGWGLLTLLLIGNFMQFYNLYSFTSRSVQANRRSLPYTHSAADYYVHPVAIDWASMIQSYITSNKTIVLVYNYQVRAENSTDPVCLLERLYLRLGHKQFSERILIFGRMKKRFSQVPIHDIAKIPEVLSRVSNLEDLVILRYQDDKNTKFLEEATQTLSLLTTKREIIPCHPPAKLWSCYQYATSHNG